MNEHRYREVSLCTAALLLLTALPSGLVGQEGLPDKVRTAVEGRRQVPTVSRTHSVESASRELLRLRYATFDPTTEQPVNPLVAGSTNLWIVQCEGQPTEAWRDSLRAAGASVLSYLPDFAYVLRVPPGRSETIRTMPFVRWLGAYDVAFRLDPELCRAFENRLRIPRQRYNIVVCDKRTDKPTLTASIARIGGVVDNVLEGSILVEATLTRDQLFEVAKLDEVLWIDRWMPREDDMDNARIQGGGNYVEAAGGYTGSGVRGHIYEGLEAGHVDFNTTPVNVSSSGNAQRHGHCTAGIVFGNGTSNAAGRGMAPDMTPFYTEYQTDVGSRNAVIDTVVNTHQCMFTTSSWGTGRVRTYTSISADADDIVFDHRIPWTQSQSNAGNQDSRPQAWAKNVISVGAVGHRNNSNPGDDSWQFGNGSSRASTGPAADGRIKPDLCAYYDSTLTSDLTGSAGYSSANWTSNFGGTSGATPIVAGHNALAIQMYTDSLFGNAPRVPGGSRFQNRPLAQTLKALQIVGARPYTFTSSSTDNRREHQGWGFPNLQDLYDSRSNMFIVAEDDILTQGQTATHTITVAGGTPRLKICMTFLDPAGNPSATLAAVNNLNLRVTAPNGTVYWGNNGLENGNTSSSGGSANAIDSVECVFLDNPAAGDWTVQVIAQSIVSDAHVATSATDASYALAVLGGGTGGPTGGNVIDSNSFEAGLGSWSNVGGDDIDWARRSGSTPSTSTGPTAAQDGSFYVYVESSRRGTGYPTMDAYLQGPTLNFSGNEQITFHYHMFGSSMGTLRLQAVSASGAVTTLWTRTGDQGNSWMQQAVDLSELSRTQTLRFFATTGTSFRSDFALDNIEIRGDGGSSGGADLNEDLEAGFGVFSNDTSGDTHEWTRRSGSTPSIGTGPTAAAQGSWYAYVEGSNPNIGQNAGLTSAALNLDGSQTLSFRYHMLGTSMGSLTVQAISSSGSTSLLWSRSGSQGSAWQTATVPLSSLSGSYRIRFFAQLGTSWSSDICIDAVSVQ